jgi:hypothetical protein
MDTRTLPCLGLVLLSALAPLTAGETAPPQAPQRLGSARFANLGRVFTVAFSADGRLVAGGAWDGSIRVWETATGKEMHQLHEHKDPVRRLAFSSDGRWLASAGKAPGLCLWDLQAGRRERVLGAPTDAAGDVAFAPDSKHVAAIARGRLRVWDIAGKELWSQGGDRIHARLAVDAADSLSSLYLTPLARRGNLAYPDENSRVYLSHWGLLSGKESDRRDLGPYNPLEPPVLGPGGLVVQRTFQPDFHRQAIAYLALGQGGAAQPIDLVLQDVTVVCVSPDGRMLAIGGDTLGGGNRGSKLIRVFEIASGKERCSFQSLDQGQLSLAFAPDGRTLASGSLDVTVLLWDLTGGTAKAKQPLTPSDLERLWNELQGSSAAAAYRAHWKLVAAAREAAPYLGSHLRPGAPPDPKRVADLIGDLGDEQYDRRNAAYAELAKLEEFAAPALRTALASAKSLEARRRMEELLKRSEQVSQDRLARLRAIETLEHMQSPAAVALLRDLAAGPAAASVTRAAADALRRLECRR